MIRLQKTTRVVITGLRDGVGGGGREVGRAAGVVFTGLVTVK